MTDQTPTPQLDLAALRELGDIAEYAKIRGDDLLALIARVKELDAKFLDKFARYEGAKMRAEAAEAKIAKVLTMHTKELGGTPTGDFAYVCACGFSYWPCATVSALDGTA